MTNSHNLQFENEVAYLYNGAALCRDVTPGHDGIKQIAPFFASIPYNPDGEHVLAQLEERLANQFPELAEFGRARALKAYGREVDTITKPSYIKRITNYRSSNINQIDNIVKIARREPASGGLAFSVFAPEDLQNRYRPGFVPCLIAGSFLLDGDEFQLTAFFRSQSIIEFAIYDLLFLRKLQREVYEELKEGNVFKSSAKLGNLNMCMSRVFIHRRLLKRKDGSFVRRDELIDNWVSLVYSHLISM